MCSYIAHNFIILYTVCIFAFTSVLRVGWSGIRFSTTASPPSSSEGVSGGLLLCFSGVVNSEEGFSSVTSRLGPFTTRPERVVVVVPAAAVLTLAVAASVLDTSLVAVDAFSSLTENGGSSVDFLGLPLLRFKHAESSEVSLNCRQRASASGTQRLVAACCTRSRLWSFNFSSPV